MAMVPATSTIVVAAVLAAVASRPLTVDTRTYTIDGSASRVLAHVGKTGLFSFAGHTHEVRAPVRNGSVVLDTNDIARSKIRLTFDAADLTVTGQGEPADDVPEVQRTMRSAQVLDVEKYPRITFVSRDIRVVDRRSDGIRARVTGDLSLHGTTRQIATDVRAWTDQDRLTASGSFTIDQTDFGIEPVTSAGGTVRVKNALRIEFTLVATRSP